MNFFPVVGLIFSLLSLVSAISKIEKSSKKCSRELEAIDYSPEDYGLSFMRNLYLGLINEGTASALIKRFADNNRVIVKVSDALGKATSITVPKGMEFYVTPQMTGPVQDVSGMRAYALGSGFDNNVKSGLLEYSGRIYKKDAKFSLVTIYVPKTRIVL